MRKVLLLGAGKIGRMIARFLLGTGEYDLLVGDTEQEALDRMAETYGADVRKIDAADADQLAPAAEGRDCVISALRFDLNPLVAQTALEAGASYFDLTEDVATTRRVREIAGRAAQGQIFMPQCGLAPGFISIVAAHLTKWFDTLDMVRMRVGALPQFPSNVLKYNLTWSTEGLINEYCNPCEAIHDNQRIEVLPLEGLESFSLDGVRYEAFHTSGGLGTLCETLEGRVRDLNYKTIRYPGHRDLMDFLIRGLRLGDRRDVLQDILENAIPITFQDVVVTFCTVTGWRNGQLVQLSDARKLYKNTFDGEIWSAIQISTAAAICAAIDLHFDGRLPERGFVRQEDINLDEFLANRFGRHYEDQAAHSGEGEPAPVG